MSNQNKSAFPCASYWDARVESYRPPETDGGLTAREYAAIKLRVPDSGTDWLDTMIERSLRDEFAAKAMQGLAAQMSNGRQLEPMTKAAYEIAGAMLEARK